jgi:uncharacterized membrane protein YbhN (UPF0104 family)
MQRINHWAASKRLRVVFALGVTAITIGVFWYYLATHVSLIDQLVHTPPLTVIMLLVLFTLWFGSLALILRACLRMCNTDLPAEENLMLNAYSTFLNYLLPGQGGLALRGLYLKARHKLPIRQYVFVTLIYFVIYAAVAMLLLIGGVGAWWQTIIGVTVVTAGAYVGARFYAKRSKLSRRGLDLSLENLAYLALATTLQAILQFAIFWLELNSVSPGLSVGQVMSYTGAANFALFVNVTPGAVGIRESFLIFSQKLHHVTNAAIVGANVLDRATYIVFLAIIFGIVVAARGRAALSLRSIRGLGQLPSAVAEPAQAPVPASKTS